MFPEYNKTYTAKDIFGYHGYDEIPPYRKLEVDSDDSKAIAESIRSMGENSCGYIDNSVVYHHFCETNTYFINMDEKYVYAYFKDVDFTGIFPLMMILDFLKFSASKMLIVFDDKSILLEKTEETEKICLILDEIYNSEPFMGDVIVKSIMERNAENVFHKLMEEYGDKYMFTDVSNYSTLDILEKVLKLNVL